MSAIFQLLLIQFWSKLLKPKFNHNSTQPNKTKVRFNTKMTWHHHQHPPPTITTTTHLELNVTIISSFSDPVWTKLQSKFSVTILNRCQQSWWHLSISALFTEIFNLIFEVQNLFQPKFFCVQTFLDPQIFGPKFFWI